MGGMIENVYHSLVNKQLFSWTEAITTLCYILRGIIITICRAVVVVVVLLNFHVYISISCSANCNHRFDFSVHCVLVFRLLALKTEIQDLNVHFSPLTYPVQCACLVFTQRQWNTGFVSGPIHCTVDRRNTYIPTNSGIISHQRHALCTVHSAQNCTHCGKNP